MLGSLHAQITKLLTLKELPLDTLDLYEVFIPGRRSGFSDAWHCIHICPCSNRNQHDRCLRNGGGHLHHVRHSHGFRKLHWRAAGDPPPSPLPPPPHHPPPHPPPPGREGQRPAPR